MITDLMTLWTSEKDLSLDPRWVVRRSSEFARLVCPLEIDGITVAGLSFSANAHVLRPDRAVSFQVEFFPPRGESNGGPLCRFEWRPQRPHDNKGIGPEELRFRKQSGCHIHPFEINWRHNPDQVRKGKLPIAIPVEPSFASYEETLAFVEKEFRIKGVSKLPPPPWQEKLL